MAHVSLNVTMYISLIEQTFEYKQLGHYLFDIQFKPLSNIRFDHVYLQFIKVKGLFQVIYCLLVTAVMDRMVKIVEGDPSTHRVTASYIIMET